MKRLMSSKRGMRAGDSCSLSSPSRIPLVRITAPAIVHAPEQLAPGRVVVLRVQLVGLVDVDVAVGARLLDERRLGRCQAGVARPSGALLPLPSL